MSDPPLDERLDALQLQWEGYAQRCDNLGGRVPDDLVMVTLMNVMANAYRVAARELAEVREGGPPCGDNRPGSGLLDLRGQLERLLTID